MIRRALELAAWAVVGTIAVAAIWAAGKLNALHRE